MTDLYLSLVIPCFNECRRILSTLQSLREYLVGDPYQGAEVIVVDDGSTDSTADLLRSFQEWDRLTLLFNETNRGKGYSVRRGVLAARGRYIFFTDADLPYDLEALGRFLTALEAGYDLAIGARDLPGSRFSVPRSAIRRLASDIFTWIVRNYAVKGIPDTQCGFKGFQREVALDLFQRGRIDGYAFDVELVFLARRRGYRIARLPVVLVHNDDSKIRVVRDSAQMLLDLFRILIYARQGVYDV
ncbi:MAG: dolichyl-phosphate beta-glucosyltransferase [Anaerolineae bacterium]